MMALLLVPLLAGLGAVPVAPEGPIPDEARVLGTVLNPVYQTVVSQLENETGEDLTGEEVDLALHVNITNAEFDLLGIVFGGGKVRADFSATAHFEFRVISLEYLDQALNASNPYSNQSLREAFGVNTTRMYLTAEEFRLAAGGVVIEAFKALQVSAAKRLITSTLSGVTVLVADFEWSNLVPVERLREGDSDTNDTVQRKSAAFKDPPIILDARFELRYLDRLALTDLLADFGSDENEADTAADTLQDRIKENRTAPILEQSAFAIIGFDQLLDFQAPPGWRLNFTITMPKGYAIEDATDELLVSGDRRSASYIADGRVASQAISNAALVTLSSRTIVVPTVFAAVAIVGILFRITVENAVRLVRAGSRKVRERVRMRRVPVKDAQS